MGKSFILCCPRGEHQVDFWKCYTLKVLHSHLLNTMHTALFIVTAYHVAYIWYACGITRIFESFTLSRQFLKVLHFESVTLSYSGIQFWSQKMRINKDCILILIQCLLKRKEDRSYCTCHCATKECCWT